MPQQKRKIPSSKTKQQSDVSTWLERETSNQRRALERASRHFDRNDAMDVHTIEAVYARESRFGQDRGKRNSRGAAGDFQIKKELAKNIGLQVSAENDERFDVNTASAAAAKILKTSDNNFKKPTVLDKDVKTQRNGKTSKSTWKKQGLQSNRLRKHANISKKSQVMSKSLVINQRQMQMKNIEKEIP